MRRTWAVLGLAVSTLASLGCAIYPGTARPASREGLLREPGWVLLESVPEVRQVSREGCGAACLAMVLRHWGVDSSVEELERECAVPGTEGIRAAALRDAARRRGLSAFLLAGTTTDLAHELSRGRPVVVGLAKPNGEEFTTHFEVVVGYHDGQRKIAALDPGIGLTCDSVDGFEAEWAATKRVMLVVFEAEAREAYRSDIVSTGGGR